MSLSNEGHNSAKQQKERKSCLHRLVDDSGFLQQILRYLCSDHRSPAGELHLQVFAKAAGVVIYGGAGVSKSLHQAVDQKDLLLQRPIISLNKTLFQLSNREINKLKGALFP